MVETIFIRMTERQYISNMNKLTKEMEARGLSCARLGRLCGFSDSTVSAILHSTVSAILRGKSYGTDYTWEAMGKCLGVEFEYEVVHENGKQKKQVTELKRSEKRVSILKPYIPRCLNEFGNVYIGRKYVRRYGLGAIIEELAKQGIKVVSRKEDDGKGYVLEEVRH